MLLDLLKIYNGPITWDMLYHPRLLIVYQYFHYITFIFTSFLSLLTGYIILKKSNEMGFYKYILLNSLLWNYFLDIIYFLYSPVNLFPYPVFYSEGVLNFLPPNAFIGFLYCFGFGIFGVLQSNSIALIYRVSLVFINSKFYDMVNDPKQYRILYVALLAFFEGMWSSM